MNEVGNLSGESLGMVKTNNSNTSSLHWLCDQQLSEVFSKEANIVFYVGAIVMALIGNGLLIAAYRRMKETIMLLIANMAASDILIAIFLPTRMLAAEVADSPAWQVSGLGGRILCKICPFLSDISISVSSHSLVIIAVDRFLAILHPLKARLITVRTRRLVIASTWIVAMASYTPYFFAFDLDHKQRCLMNNKSAFLRYTIFLAVTVIYLPVIALVIIYPITVFYLRRDIMAEHRNGLGTGKKRFRQRSMKLFRLATATVMSFIIFWLPFSTISLLKYFIPEKLPQCNYLFKAIYQVSHVLMISYSAVNPFICFIFLRNFRNELRNICKRRKRNAYLATTSRNRTRSGGSSSGTMYSLSIRLS